MLLKLHKLISIYKIFANRFKKYVINLIMSFSLQLDVQNNRSNDLPASQTQTRAKETAQRTDGSVSRRKHPHHANAAQQMQIFKGCHQGDVASTRSSHRTVENCIKRSRPRWIPHSQRSKSPISLK